MRRSKRERQKISRSPIGQYRHLRSNEERDWMVDVRGGVSQPTVLPHMLKIFKSAKKL